MYRGDNKMNMKKLMGNVAFAAIILVIITRFFTLFAGAPYPVNIVTSSSMQPTLQRGDIVIWVPCRAEQVEEGDIIVYKSVYGHLLIHRVVEVKDGTFITKGDANEYTDQSGPHLPEPPVSDRNLQGKTIMVGTAPLKLPCIGFLWIYLQDSINSMATHIRWEEPQPAWHYLIFAPFIGFIALLFLVVIVWMPNGKSARERLHELIFGVERLSLRKTCAYALTFFIPFLLLTSFFAYDSLEIENSEGTRLTGAPVSNPSLLPVKGIMFVEGEEGIYPEETIITIQSGEVKEIDISYGDTHASGTLFLSSSPYWMLVPTPLTEAVYGISPRLCILFSALVSAIIMSVLTVLLLLISSVIVERYYLTAAYLPLLTMGYHPKMLLLYRYSDAVRKKVKKIKRVINSMALWVTMLDRRAVYASCAVIPFLPLLFDGVDNLFLTSLFSSLAIATVAYALGCRLKNEYACASFIASAFISFIFTARMVVSVDEHALILLFQYLSISLILLTLLFAVSFSTMLFFTALLHYLRERRNPAVMMEVCDI